MLKMILSQAKNNNYIYSAHKSDGQLPNIFEIEDTGLQYGVAIDYLLFASTLHQYANM